MTTITRDESGVTFTLHADHSFFPEDKYTGKPFEKVAHVDFITRNDDSIDYVEVKTNAPVDIVASHYFLCELSEKFKCGLILHAATRSGRIADLGWPDSLLDDAVATMKIRLILIITLEGFKTEWLPPLKDKLQSRLKSITNAIGNATVAVTNPKLAQQKGIIVDFDYLENKTQ